MKKTISKAICAILAGVSVIGSSAMLGGCTTSHPEVEMQLAFNGKTYTVEYTLYRKFAPNTVEHFLQLAEYGYYDGLCVHSYSGNKLYTGGYTYDATKAEDGGLVYKSYYDEVKNIENYAHSVWADTAKQVPTYTLYGEFSANNVKVQNGKPLSQDFGSLTMYYSNKGSNDDTIVVEKIDGTGTDSKQYLYNSATSLFYIQLGTATTNNSKYCTFAKLKDSSEDELKALQEAINAYIEANYQEAEDGKAAFAPSVEVAIDEDDPFVGDAGIVDTFSVPEKEIKINYVKVIKF